MLFVFKFVKFQLILSINNELQLHQYYQKNTEIFSCNPRCIDEYGKGALKTLNLQIRQIAFNL